MKYKCKNCGAIIAVDFSDLFKVNPVTVTSESLQKNLCANCDKRSV